MSTEPQPQNPAPTNPLVGAARDFIVGILGMVFDKNAVALVVPPAAILGYLDLPKLLTLLEWMLYAAILAGFAVQISRIVFPQILLSKLMEKAASSGPGAATVVASVVIFVGALMLSLALWTKP